ncbi:MAG: FN3 associated domain-containing protein [Saprospiraceae bacterium]|nr:FN3 associated domain-containing protein [Saprospiraceae bacterium]
MALIQLFGKLHPLILHLPIGILIYAYLHLGYVNYIKKKETIDISFALLLGCIFSLLSAASGIVLSNNGTYEGDGLEVHRWLGIATAIGSIGLWYYYKRVQNKHLFFGVFTIIVVLLVLTGHFGGSLTHGEGFLSVEDAPNGVENEIADISQAHVFNDLVMPIVKRKCASCHNPKKKKGDLLLHTLEGWKKGGETGPFITLGDSENSLLLTRVHLPSSEKKHMPPSGKLQLKADEIEFLEWWIGAADDFSATVEMLSPPENIQQFIQSKIDPSSANIPKIDKSKLLAIQKDGVPVQQISKDLPWLAVHYPKGSTINNKAMNKLMAFDENIRALHLSETNLNDKELEKINRFQNLTTLDISRNSITSKGIAKLTDLNKLEVLNLYQTKVDKSLMGYLSQFPKLKQLYLWQTNITEDDLSKVSFSNSLYVDLGQDLDVFGAVQLLPPTIVGGKTIFQDSISVEINHVASNAKIYYTLDGSTPSANSELYMNPIILYKTKQINTMATMEGWQPSKLVSKSFLKSTYLPTECNIVPEPNEKYAANGNVTLINGEKGSEQFSDGNWLGFSASDVSIILNMGEVKEVNSVSFGCLQDYRSYIFKPLGATISVSTNGKDFSEVKSETYAQITGPDDVAVKDFIVEIPFTTTQYIKLEIQAQKKNPKWHADPGADCWLFLDEVVVD